MRIDRDSFEEWQANQITEAVLRVCVVWAEEAKAQWLRVSWDGEQPDPVILAKLRERAAVLEAIAALTVETIEEALG